MVFKKRNNKIHTTGGDYPLRFAVEDKMMFALSTTFYFACDNKGLDPSFFPTVSGQVTITSKVPSDTDQMETSIGEFDANHFLLSTRDELLNWL